jgi:hypothetical protein
MTEKMTDLSAFGPRRRNRATGEAALHEQRARADVTSRKLPDAVEHRHRVAVSQSPRLLTEDERRRAASYTIPEAELKQRAADQMRSEISEPVKEVARRLRLNLLATRTLETIYRAQRAAGDVYISLSPASIADILNSHPQQSGGTPVTAQQVRDLISVLEKLGALNQKPGATFSIGMSGSQPSSLGEPRYADDPAHPQASAIGRGCGCGKQTESIDAASCAERRFCPQSETPKNSRLRATDIAKRLGIGRASVVRHAPAPKPYCDPTSPASWRRRRAILRAPRIASERSWLRSKSGARQNRMRNEGTYGPDNILFLAS